MSLNSCLNFGDHSTDPIYINSGITFSLLQHLDTIGLLSYAPSSTFGVEQLPVPLHAQYQNQEVVVHLKHGVGEIATGCVVLSKSGQELATVCAPRFNENFLEYVVEKWRADGQTVSRPCDMRTEITAV